MFGKRRTTEVVPFDVEPSQAMGGDEPADSAPSTPQLISIEGTEAYRADVVDTKMHLRMRMWKPSIDATLLSGSVR